MDRPSSVVKFQNCDFETLCKDKTVTGAILRELITHGKRVGLEKWEMPGAVNICQVGSLTYCEVQVVEGRDTHYQPRSAGLCVCGLL